MIIVFGNVFVKFCSGDWIVLKINLWIFVLVNFIVNWIFVIIVKIINVGIIVVKDFKIVGGILLGILKVMFFCMKKWNILVIRSVIIIVMNNFCVFV